MATAERETAVGVFTDFAHAEQALDELKKAGFTPEQIGFLADDPSRVEAPPLPTGTHARKDAAIGATVGGFLGAAVGFAVAAFVLPVGGAVIAGGLLAGVLGGAVTGGASGGIVGALIGLNVPEDEARHWAQQFHSGRCLVTVQAGSRYEEAAAILKRVAEEPEHHRHRSHDLSGGGGSGDGGGSAFVPRP